MDINNEITEKMLNLWADCRIEWSDSFKTQIEFFANIKRSVPKIIKFFEELPNEKKEILRKSGPIPFHLWKAFKDNKIDFKKFQELNINYYKDYRNSKSYFPDQKKLLLDINLEESYINLIDEEYQKFSEGEHKVDWFYEQNLEYYSLLIEDDSIKDIIETITFILKNTNANRGARGASKRTINQKNSLYQLLELFSHYKEIDYSKFDEICSQIFLVDKIAKESYGFFNLDKPKGFMYNGRVNSIFKFLFKNFDKYTNELAIVSPFYELLKQRFKEYFKDKIELDDINSLLIENDINLNEEELRNFQINLQVDQMIYCYSSKRANKWLFIVPIEYEDGNLWDYCKNNSVVAMQYQKGIQSERQFSVNIKEIKKIKEGDIVVVYINKKIVGGIGAVTKEFYENISQDNGFNGKFGQRIDLNWMDNKFEKSLEPIKDQLKISKNNFVKLAAKTIHELSETDYLKILSLFEISLSDSISNIKVEDLLTNKKQIILYGPPGTGKTYNTKNIVMRLIKNG